MSVYRVECVGEAREVYLVEAESESDAMQNWHQGYCLSSEAQGMDPISAAIDPDEELFT